jgi:hypothetical protein
VQIWNFLTALLWKENFFLNLPSFYNNHCFLPSIRNHKLKANWFLNSQSLSIDIIWYTLAPAGCSMKTRCHLQRCDAKNNKDASCSPQPAPSCLLHGLHEFLVSSITKLGKLLLSFWFIRSLGDIKLLCAYSFPIRLHCHFDMLINSGLCTCKAGALPLKPHIQCSLLWLFWRWVL